MAVGTATWRALMKASAAGMLASALDEGFDVAARMLASDAGEEDEAVCITCYDANLLLSH